MTIEPVALAERLLGLLEEGRRSSTYKPALLLALVDRAPEHLDDPLVPVTSLAERVIELYWPQTLGYPTTGAVLQQNQGAQATIVRDVAAFRAGRSSRTLAEALRRGAAWERVVEQVEHALASMPIPRLQQPFEPFLYDFSWSWADAGGWAAGRYRASPRAVVLRAGVADALVRLGPLLRPFITRWWTDKAAQLNKHVDDARSLVDFEAFLFGRDRVALERIGEGLLDLQAGQCFYCEKDVGRAREIDHFVPWSHSGDDGLDNLVATCRTCNNAKRAVLAGPSHLAGLLERNRRWSGDLAAIATERTWPRDGRRSHHVRSAAYLRGPDDRSLWSIDGSASRLERLGVRRQELAVLLARESGRITT